MFAAIRIPSPTKVLPPIVRRYLVSVISSRARASADLVKTASSGMWPGVTRATRSPLRQIRHWQRSSRYTNPSSTTTRRLPRRTSSSAFVKSRVGTKDALVQQFNATYGTDVNSLTSWQALVGAVGIDPIPNSLDECQTIILGLHVNLVDLVDAREDGPNTMVELFDSLQSLRTYTIEEEKFFPKENAGLIVFALRKASVAVGEGAGEVVFVNARLPQGLTSMYFCVSVRACGCATALREDNLNDLLSFWTSCSPRAVG
ncbi:hypothetical protein PENSPDRAFT_228214 [Peniophora sp. CONT]|nr:hypothetical protein PENSPDRAFT_228214 [Peniophora sp. CONT]